MNYKEHVQALWKSASCPFCKEKDFVIDKNSHAFVLAARAPYTQDHLLVCSSRHVETLAELTEQELQDLYMLLTKWEAILHKKHGELVVFLRQGSVLGPTWKSIAHLHWHIVPNFKIQYGWSQESSDERVLLDETQMKSIVDSRRDRRDLGPVN